MFRAISSEIMLIRELDAGLDFRTVARLSATLTCPGSCAVCKKHLKDVDETRLATLVCISEFSTHGEPLNSMDVYMLLAQHGILIFPYCNLEMFYAQTQIMTGKWFCIIFVCILICI